MNLEIKKLKRTGYFSIFLLGGLLSAAVPVINMAARSELYTSLSGNPVTILLDANWQMMAMLNILVCICGTCIMYHTEYADNGFQKMDVLPIRTGKLFLHKFVIAALSGLAVIVIETVSLSLCILHWFPEYDLTVAELAQTAGFAVILMLPTIILMLVIASACKNMWISLGIGVILIFTLNIFPGDHLVLNLCPFSSPYQILDTVRENSQLAIFTGTCAIETVFFGLIELIYLKFRRCFA